MSCYQTFQVKASHEENNPELQNSSSFVSMVAVFTYLQFQLLFLQKTIEMELHMIFHFTHDYILWTV